MNRPLRTLLFAGLLGIGLLSGCVFQIGLLPKDGTPSPTATSGTLLSFAPTATAFPLQELRLAYQNFEAGNMDIFIVQGDGENVFRLTNNPATDHKPHWNATGDRIAFISDRDGNATLYVADAACTVAVESPSEGCATPPQRISFGSTFDTDPAWSPNSQEIAFPSFRDGRLDIYLIHPDGSNLRRLTELPDRNEVPIWSPDGQTIIFENVDAQGNVDLYMASAACAWPVDGSAPPEGCNNDLRRISNHAAFDGNPAWSPDGDRVAFVSERDGYTAIYVQPTACAPPVNDPDQPLITACESAPRRLTDDPAGSKSPIWSPDGLNLAYLGGESALFTISAACTRTDEPCLPSPQILADLSAFGPLSNPSWSPDSRRLAFVVGQEILVIDTKCPGAPSCDGPLTPLVQFPGMNPMWAPR